MQLFYSDIFVLPLPDGHRFPMRKYSLPYERVAQSGLAPPGAIQMPPAASLEQMTRAHDAEYLRRVIQGELTDKELRRIGFPWSPQLMQRSLQTVGGTIAACRAALVEGVAVNLAGGYAQSIDDIVDIHFRTVSIAREVLWRQPYHQPLDTSTLDTLTL